MLAIPETTNLKCSPCHSKLHGELAKHLRAVRQLSYNSQQNFQNNPWLVSHQSKGSDGPSNYKLSSNWLAGALQWHADSKSAAESLWNNFTTPKWLKGNFHESPLHVPLEHHRLNEFWKGCQMLWYKKKEHPWSRLFLRDGAMEPSSTKQELDHRRMQKPYPAL